MLQGISDSNTDLLGRTGSGEDDMFKDMEDVKLIFSDYVNEVIDGLAFGYNLDNMAWKVLNSDDLQNGAEIGLTGALPNPFTPKFELLVPEGNTLKIQRAPTDDNGQPRDAEIDFKIAVEAGTDLDYQVKF